MNLKEFAALKTGDRIIGMDGFSKGEVVATDDSGITLRWDGSPSTFHFTAQSTAWMHWTRETTGDA